LKKQAQFTTAAFGVEFTDKNKAANHDDPVLEQMVNAHVTDEAKEEKR